MRMKMLESVEQEHAKKDLPDFRVGDVLRLSLRVKEGDKTRTQIFEGVCIARRGRSTSASFSVVKESHGDIVEKTFPLHSPTLEKITVVKKGKARRAKLYSLLNKK